MSLLPCRAVCHLDPLVPTGPASSGSTAHSLDSFHNQSPVSSPAPLAFAAALPGVLLPLTSTQMVHLSLLSPPHGGLVQQRRLVTLYRIILKQCSADHLSQSDIFLFIILNLFTVNCLFTVIYYLFIFPH